MRKLSQSPAASLPANFIKGQLWQVGLRFVEIGHVGRLLVNHRIVVPTLKRSPSRPLLISIKELQKYLASNNAVLVESMS
ncbi:MAG TPA: hypothetical protein VGF13_19430 [Verrucomicrobiae bacterium]|jgi:hypothetical protein